MPLNINEDLRKRLSPEIVKSLEEAAKDTDLFLGSGTNYIPKERFDEVNTSLKDYKAQIAERDKQLNELAPKLKGHEDLEKSVTELRNLNAKTVNDYEAKILERDRNYALNDMLRTYKPRNVKAVTALLDHSKIEFKDGALKGAEEQLEALRKSDDYLFEGANGNQQVQVGVKPGNVGTQQTLDETLSRAFNLKSGTK